MRNSQLAHEWANGATRGKGSSMFVDGDTIYSYGAHFPMGRRVTNEQGAKAFLYTSRTYSVTTSKHLGYVRNALHGLGLPVFVVYDPSATPRSSEALNEYTQRIEEAMQAAVKARKYANLHLARAQSHAEEANAMSRFYGWAWTIDRPELTPEYAAQVAENARLQKIRDAKREEARKAREAERLEEWRRGETDAGWNLSGVTALRLKGDTVETSRGAEVPVTHAKRLWPLVKKCRETHSEYRHGEHSFRLGNFVLNEVDAEGNVRIGCHRIEFAEMARIAPALGLS